MTFSLTMNTFTCKSRRSTIDIRHAQDRPHNLGIPAMSKIESVEFVRLYPITFKESWGKDSIWPGSPPCFIVRITAENGIYGVGEISSQPWYLGETAEHLAASLKLYAERLKGTDPSNIRAVHRTMEMALSGGMPGGRGARAGVDMALHDLLGKLWGVPVSTLLGGARRNRIDLMTNLYHKTPDAMAKASASFVAEGFRALKIKVGDVIWRDGVSSRSIVEETSFLEAALSVVPREIMIDAVRLRIFGYLMESEAELSVSVVSC